jgi:hypothetical protein
VFLRKVVMDTGSSKTLEYKIITHKWKNIKWRISTFAMEKSVKPNQQYSHYWFSPLVSGKCHCINNQYLKLHSHFKDWDNTNGWCHQWVIKVAQPSLMAYWKSFWTKSKKSLSDDLLINSQTYEQHLEIIELVMQRLENMGIKSFMGLCNFVSLYT